MSASSFHMWWHQPGVRYERASVTLTVLDEPVGDDTYFWAMQVDFTDASGDLTSGAHTGLQWINGYPYHKAVNWGGYRTSDNSILSGSTSSLPSALANDNTRNYNWTRGVSYRLSVFQVPSEPGQPVGTSRWRSTVTDLSTNTTTIIRDLYAYGDRIHGVACWSEIFAPCTDPSASVRWSDFEGIEYGTSTPVEVDTFYIWYQDGGCTNTSTYADTLGGMRQVTGTTRTNTAGDFLTLDNSGSSRVTVRLRNEANTTTTATLLDAFDAGFRVERNDLGSGSFRMDKRDPQRSLISKGAVVQFLVDDQARFTGRISEETPVEAAEGEEGAEATEFSVVDILDDWDFAVVRLSTVPQCDLVPTLDERTWNWASGEYNPHSTHESWPLASAIANQGWGSTFYTGQPAGWSDPDAWFLWASTGDQDNADPGRCYFKDIFLVGAGKKVLDWAADNQGTLYVNGKRVQDGDDFRKKQTYEFETTSGFLTLAWEVLNLADDGPPGGNPGGLIFSLRENSPEGNVLRRSGASGVGANTATHMRMLEYPVSPPGHSIGAVIRLAAEQNPIIWDTWTLNFTDLVDSNGVPFPIVDELTFRLYDDSVLDVLKIAAQNWIDFRVEPGPGKVLSAYVKGTIAQTVGVPLVTGYSGAGLSNPDSVNVLDLEWELTPPEYTALGVRYADGWIEVGDGDRWGTLRVEQYDDPAVAESIGSILLDAYNVDQQSAAFTYLPMNEPTDQPLAGVIMPHDVWNIPGPINHDTTTVQVIHAVSVSATENGEARFDIEVGPPILDQIEWLERSVRRSGPGNLRGRAASASAVSGKQPFHNNVKPRGYAPTAGQPAHVIASAPGIAAALTAGAVSLPKVSIAPCLFVGMVTNLRLIGQGGSGTSTVTVSDGTTTWTLTGSADGLVDFEGGINKTWTTSTILTVTFTAVGHDDLHVIADVGDVN